jgi:hypothetical protein
MGKKKSPGNVSAKAAKKAKAVQKVEKKEKKASKPADDANEDLEGILEKVFLSAHHITTTLFRKLNWITNRPNQ